MDQMNRHTRPGVTRTTGECCTLPGNGGAAEQGMGTLPASAALANPYVPFQRTGSKQYEPGYALIRGTLFPGLELPFMGMVNNDPKDTPVAELMAMHFVLVELNQYLDTHPEDREALEVFKKYAGQYRDRKASYEENYGPLCITEAGGTEKFNWIDGPWPWDYEQEGDE